MSGADSIITHIAALGDGVTADGRHFPLTAPGDVVAEDGTITRGGHYNAPPCPHYGACGGCHLQHIDEDSWREYVTSRVVGTAKWKGLDVGEVLPTHLSPIGSRRRATLHGTFGKGAVLGFRGASSHDIADLSECTVMMPELAALIAPLRALLSETAGKGTADIHLTLSDQGAVIELRKFHAEDYASIQRLTDFAQAHRLARLSIDQGEGAEVQWEPEPVTITLGAVAVPLPMGAFLQPTQDGEARMLADASEWLTGTKKCADLFSGLGTFAFALHAETGAKILAAEAARDSHLACNTAANGRGLPVHAIHRDLFRTPLRPDELNNFDAVILDPPRAGAKEQIREIAASKLSRVVYVSCNPSSWARDAEPLIAAGFRLEKLRPIGQFRWSTHVELSSYFTR